MEHGVAQGRAHGDRGAEMSQSGAGTGVAALEGDGLPEPLGDVVGIHALVPLAGPHQAEEPRLGGRRAGGLVGACPAVELQALIGGVVGLADEASQAVS